MEQQNTGINGTAAEDLNSGHTSEELGKLELYPSFPQLPTHTTVIYFITERVVDFILIMKDSNNAKEYRGKNHPKSWEVFEKVQMPVVYDWRDGGGGGSKMRLWNMYVKSSVQVNLIPSPGSRTMAYSRLKEKLAIIVGDYLNTDGSCNSL